MTTASRPRRHSRISSMAEYERLYRESLADTENFWRRQSELLTWFHPPQNVLDQDMEEAARTLGASSLTIFFRIVLPTLIPAILTGAALSFSRALGEFGSIVIVAGNIPFKTQVASVYIYGEIESYNIQGALGVSVILLLSSFLILVLLHLLKNWSRRYEKAE